LSVPLNVVKGWIGIIFLPLLVIGLWKDVRISPTGLLRALFLFAYASIILLYPCRIYASFFLRSHSSFCFLLARASVVVEKFQEGAKARVGDIRSTPGKSSSGSPSSNCHFDQRYTSAVDAHRDGRASFVAAGYYATPWELAGEALSTATDPRAVVASASGKRSCQSSGARKVLQK